MWFSVNSVNCKELITQVQQLEKHSDKGGKDSKKKEKKVGLYPNPDIIDLD